MGGTPKNARQIGYTSINYDLIYGLPTQTLQGLTHTMMLVAGLMPDRIAFYSYAHLLWLKPGQRRFSGMELPGTGAKTDLYQLGRRLLKNEGYLEIGMDHFALPGDTLLKAEHNGKLHRNFMGYTGNHTRLLIGLGVSAISDTWYAFTQNVMVVEECLELVGAGELPVFKGHILTVDDLIIRKHILNLMCKGHTAWNYEFEACDVWLEGIERLQPLIDDKLIDLDSSVSQVTPLGKRFLRNICVALDARLWADRPST